jgi:hypothetical protein
MVLHAATSKVENLAQGSSCQLKFVHAVCQCPFPPSQAEKEKKLRAMGRALADLKSEMLLAAQEGGSTIGHSKQVSTSL